MFQAFSPISSLPLEAKSWSFPTLTLPPLPPTLLARSRYNPLHLHHATQNSSYLPWSFSRTHHTPSNPAQHSPVLSHDSRMPPPSHTCNLTLKNIFILARGGRNSLIYRLRGIPDNHIWGYWCNFKISMSYIPASIVGSRAYLHTFYIWQNNKMLMKLNMIWNLKSRVKS